MSDSDMGETIAVVPKNASEEVRVSLSEFRGTELIDVRVFADYRTGSGERQATKKGVSLKLERLPALIEALQAAQAKACAAGRLKPPAEADPPPHWSDRD